MADVVMERDVRGIPLWLLREYLEEAGGVARNEHEVRGDGWHARLTQLEDFELGSLRVGQVRLVISGKAEAMDELMPKVEQKLLRAGG
jgi:hypothetical protein